MQIAPRFQVRGEVTDQKWLGSAHATDNARTVTIDGAKIADFTKQGYLPAGTPLTAGEGGKFAPATASDELAGFLLVDQPVGTPAADVIAPLLDHGRIRVKFLPEGAPDVTAMPGNSHFIFVKED
ncbi:hypothetical protein [uncultured Corynebacterium sp.]|uniref:hypothetical protein n=1 Tax=uncultured Corynebacterium sp. TaxID=159447 RepID=UPI002596085C|nr:hypothetical protein [uncultured Corynebacterium sp.]